MSEQQESILVVDDSKISLAVISRSLSKNYQVYQAENAQEALKVLGKNYVDIVLSDYQMPGMDGLELLAEVEQKYHAVGRILVTAFSNAESIVDAINSGSIDKCIGKPWKEEQHLPIVRDSLISLEKKKVEAQMIHNAKLVSLGELAAGIVHELNNPLTFIDANLRNLNKFLKKIMGLFDSYDDLNIPEEIKEEIKKRKEKINYDYLKNRVTEMVDKSRDGADRMKNIILDMKKASRQADAKFEEANLNDALDSTLNIIVHEHKNRIEIIRDYSDLPSVKCNISKLSQVFMNLLVNSCHAIKEKGEIRIKTCMESEMLIVKISDSGEGIPENIVAKMFESFFTTKPMGKGTGLGLSISKRIIKEHKGEINVDSKVGEGTTFTIKIPSNLEQVEE